MTTPTLPTSTGAPANTRPPLRIAFVSPGSYPPDFSGAQLRLHRTMLRLRQQHPIDVRVLALAGEQTQVGWSDVDGIPVRRLPTGAGFLKAFCQAGAHLIRERRAGIDVVYTVTTGRLVYFCGMWAQLLRCPLVVEFVNNNIEDSPQRRFMARNFARSAALAIAISRPIVEQFRRLGVREQVIWARPNPVDTDRFRQPDPEQREAARQRFGIARDSIAHVVVGVLSERKNHGVAIDAIERLPPPHQLIIAGPVWPAEQAYAADLAARITASPAKARITLITDFVPDIEQLMFAADCLWMPSREEGLGNVMLEALCCGVPCIISSHLGLDEHIREGGNGRQAPPAAVPWTDAVCALLPLLHDAEARRQLGQRARATYDSRLIDAELYRRLLALRSAGRSA